MKHILSVMTSYIMLGKSPIKWRQRPNMITAVDWDIKHQFKQNQLDSLIEDLAPKTSQGRQTGQTT